MIIKRSKVLLLCALEYAKKHKLSFEQDNFESLWNTCLTDSNDEENISFDDVVDEDVTAFIASLESQHATKITQRANKIIQAVQQLNEGDFEKTDDFNKLKSLIKKNELPTAEDSNAYKLYESLFKDIKASDYKEKNDIKTIGELEIFLLYQSNKNEIDSHVETLKTAITQSNNQFNHATFKALYNLFSLLMKLIQTISTITANDAIHSLISILKKNDFDRWIKKPIADSFINTLAQSANAATDFIQSNFSLDQSHIVSLNATIHSYNKDNNLPSVFYYYCFSIIISFATVVGIDDGKFFDAMNQNSNSNSLENQLQFLTNILMSPKEDAKLKSQTTVNNNENSSSSSSSPISNNYNDNNSSSHISNDDDSRNQNNDSSSSSSTENTAVRSTAEKIDLDTDPQQRLYLINTSTDLSNTERFRRYNELALLARPQFKSAELNKLTGLAKFSEMLYEQLNQQTYRIGFAWSLNDRKEYLIKIFETYLKQCKSSNEIVELYNALSPGDAKNPELSPSLKMWHNILHQRTWGLDEIGKATSSTWYDIHGKIKFRLQEMVIIDAIDKGKSTPYDGISPPVKTILTTHRETYFWSRGQTQTEKSAENDRVNATVQMASKIAKPLKEPIEKADAKNKTPSTEKSVAEKQLQANLDADLKITGIQAFDRLLYKNAANPPRKEHNGIVATLINDAEDYQRRLNPSLSDMKAALTKAVADFLNTSGCTIQNVIELYAILRKDTKKTLTPAQKIWHTILHQKEGFFDGYNKVSTTSWYTIHGLMKRKLALLKFEAINQNEENDESHDSAKVASLENKIDEVLYTHRKTSFWNSKASEENPSSGLFACFAFNQTKTKSRLNDYFASDENHTGIKELIKDELSERSKAVQNKI